jgi:hypothetical protein
VHPTRRQLERADTRIAEKYFGHLSPGSIGAALRAGLAGFASILAPSGNLAATEVSASVATEATARPLISPVIDKEETIWAAANPLRAWNSR